MRFAGVWLLFVAWASCTGWVLSWMGALNLAGYLVALMPLVAGTVLIWHQTGGDCRPFRCHLRSFRKPAAIGWLVAMLLSLIGGLCYAPSNYDALSYRLPRVIYWWQENYWHWLPGLDGRMNYSGTGFEWQMLPLLVLCRSDRVLFLLNWLPAVLLPYLVFHSLRLLGCSPRVAARWMWALPLAYGLALQTSSIGNDAQGAILAVAALAFCRLAETRESVLALLLAATSIAATTALKGSNLPLALPLGLAVLRVLWRRPALRRPAILTAAIVPLVMISFLPTAVLNHRFSGTWTGDPLNAGGLQITRPIPGVTGNVVNLVTGSLQPPVLPLSKGIQREISSTLGDDGELGRFIRTGFPRFKAQLGGEIPIEEYAGLGLAVTVLLLVHLFSRKTGRLSGAAGLWLMAGASLIAIGAYMVKLGSENTARIMLPYYPLAIGCLLALTPRRPVRSRILGGLYVWLTPVCLLPALLLNPNRPLLPLETLARTPGMPAEFSKRLDSIHAGYSDRNDPLAPLRKALPPECGTVGFAGAPTRSSYSLMRPYGARRVVEVVPDTIGSIDWVVASEWGVRERLGVSWNDWLASSGFWVAERREVVFYTRAGAEEWFLLRRQTPVDRSPERIEE